MWQARLPLRPRDDALALQSAAERAGSALACPYSSSTEFEAAVIASKLRAGLYGWQRRRRRAIYAGAAAGLLAVALLAI